MWFLGSTCGDYSAQRTAIIYLSRMRLPFGRTLPLLLLAATLLVGAEGAPVRVLVLPARSPTEGDRSEISRLLLQQALAQLPRIELVQHSSADVLLEQAWQRADLEALDTLLRPDAFLSLEIPTMMETSGRSSPLFFMGEQRFNQTIQLSLFRRDTLLHQGVLTADTSVGTGWCGVLQCLARKVDAGEATRLHQLLLNRLQEELRLRMELVLKSIPPAPPASAQRGIP
jgi:hypothetical protein